MTIFEKTGPVNTEETLNIALKTAKERNLDIVVASSEGDTALSLMQKAKEAGFAGKIVCVSCAYGSKTPGENRFSQERRTTLEQNGIRVVTAAHALSGGERGLTKMFGSVHPVELIAYTLRMFGQGTKVCDGSGLRQHFLWKTNCGNRRKRQRGGYSLCAHSRLYRKPDGN